MDSQKERVLNKIYKEIALIGQGGGGQVFLYERIPNIKKSKFKLFDLLSNGFEKLQKQAL